MPIIRTYIQIQVYLTISGRLHAFIWLISENTEGFFAINCVSRGLQLFNSVYLQCVVEGKSTQLTIKLIVKASLFKPDRIGFNTKINNRECSI